MPPMTSTAGCQYDRPIPSACLRGRGLAAVVAVAIAACGGGSSSSSASPAKDGFTQAPQTSGPLTVWVDSTRVPAAQAYQKAHPNVKLNIVTYDGDANGSNYLQTKVDLFNRTGQRLAGCRVQHPEQRDDLGGEGRIRRSAEQGPDPAVDPGQLRDGRLGVCTVDGTVYCLRNDLAQTVLWYNATLMKKWGYQVPTTWEQYQALGQKVAKQHPGYLVGNAGDTFTPEIYMWASKCEASDITGPSAVTVNVTTPNCTRMASLLDTLIKTGSMSKLSVFSTDFDKNEKGKILMLPGPAWYGGAVFDRARASTRRRARSLSLPCRSGPASPTASTGNVGGGTWLLSAHTAHLKAAIDFLTWVTTANDYQGKLAPGYPAYAPAAKVWLAHQAQLRLLRRRHPAAVLEQAAGQVWPGWGYGQWSQEAIWAATVTPGLTAGQDHRLAAARLADARSTTTRRSDGYTGQPAE